GLAEGSSAVTSPSPNLPNVNFVPLIVTAICSSLGSSRSLSPSAIATTVQSPSSALSSFFASSESSAGAATIQTSRVAVNMIHLAWSCDGASVPRRGAPNNQYECNGLVTLRVGAAQSVTLYCPEWVGSVARTYFFSRLNVTTTTFESFGDSNLAGR